jgi:hypothetical protein
MVGEGGKKYENPGSGISLTNILQYFAHLRLAMISSFGNSLGENRAIGQQIQQLL